MLNHPPDSLVCVDGDQQAIRVRILKDTVHFIGKSLPDLVDSAVIKDDIFETLKPDDQPSRL